MLGKLSNNKLTKKKLFYPCLLLATFAAILAYYIVIKSIYPYYFSWDMDLTTVIDSFLINTDLLPAHFAHSSLGIYLLLKLTQNITNALGGASIISLHDLKDTLSPIFGVAKATDFVRGHNPFLGLGFVFFSFISFRMLFKEYRLLSYLFLILLATENSILRYIATTRSELYAVTLWSISIFLCSALVSIKNNKGKLFLLVGIGISMGLTFTTKVQSIFYIATVPFFLLLMDIIKNNKLLLGNLFIEDKTLNKIAKFNVVSLILFTIFGALVPVFDVASFRVYSFRSYFFKIQWLALAFGTFIAVKLSKKSYLNLNFIASSDKGKIIFRNLSIILNLVILGFILSFLFPMLLYPSSLKTGLIYCGLLFKVTMLGTVTDSVFTVGTISTFTSFINNILEFKFIYFPLFATIAFLYISKKKSLLKLSNESLVSIVFIITIHILFLYVGVRYAPKDFLWNVTIPLYMLFFLMMLSLKGFSASRFYNHIKVAVAIIVIGLAYSNISRYETRFQDYHKFPYEDGRGKEFLSGVYGANQDIYTNIMNSYFFKPELTNLYLRQASNHSLIYSSLNNLLLLGKFNEKQISIAKEDSLAFKYCNNGYVIKSVPKFISGSTIVSFESSRYVRFKSSFDKTNKEVYLFTDSSFLLDKYVNNSINQEHKYLIKTIKTTLANTGVAPDIDFVGLQITRDNVGKINKMIKHSKGAKFILAVKDLI